MDRSLVQMCPCARARARVTGNEVEVLEKLSTAAVKPRKRRLPQAVSPKKKSASSVINTDQALVDGQQRAVSMLSFLQLHDINFH